MQIFEDIAASEVHAEASVESAPAEIPPLYGSCLSIRTEKCIHLQQLTNVLPKDYHPFYDSLKHSCISEKRPQLLDSL